MQQSSVLTPAMWGSTRPPDDVKVDMDAWFLCIPALSLVSLRRLFESSMTPSYRRLRRLQGQQKATAGSKVED